MAKKTQEELKKAEELKQEKAAKAKAKREAKLKKLWSEIDSTAVNTFSGKKSLGQLIRDGVIQKTKYFTMVNKVITDKETGEKKKVLAEKVIDFGLKFKDGFEIKGVKGQYYKIAGCDEECKIQVRA